MVRFSKSRGCNSPVGSNPTLSALCIYMDDVAFDEDDAEDSQPGITLAVDRANSGERLDQFIASQLDGTSRSEVQRWIELESANGANITVNGAKCKSSYKIRAGDLIHVVSAPRPPVNAQPENIPITVVYEDDHILVVDKARGMVVHPAPGSPNGTLVNALLGYTSLLSTAGEGFRPGIVHRLDRDTGGLMVVARTDTAHANLQAQIQSRNAKREYQALVWGQPQFKTADVDAPIGRHPNDRKKMAVITTGDHTARHAVTHLEVLENLHCFSLLHARLDTGRTHQIRVHCAFAGHSIVGDPLYGGIRSLPNLNNSTLSRRISSGMDDLHGQALHAVKLSFNHPLTGERLTFTSPLPPAMLQLINILRSE